MDGEASSFWRCLLRGCSGGGIDGRRQIIMNS